MKQTQGNPTLNESITISTYAFTSTGASGTVNASGGVDVSALEKGQSIILDLSGASAQGFTDLAEYFVIPVNSSSFRIASTQANALAGTFLTSASGNAGAGTVYPNYKIGGVLYVGTSGDVNCRGIQNSKTGSTAFSIQKNVADGSTIAFMLKDVCAKGTTATDLVAWSN